MFFHSNGFEVNGINGNWMVQGQEYTVDEASLPSLIAIIFCEQPKINIGNINVITNYNIEL